MYKKGIIHSLYKQAVCCLLILGWLLQPNHLKNIACGTDSFEGGMQHTMDSLGGFVFFSDQGQHVFLNSLSQLHFPMMKHMPLSRFHE